MKFLKLINDFPYDFSHSFPFVFTKSDEKQRHLEHTDDVLACPERCFTIEIDGGWLTSGEMSNDFKIGCIYCEELGSDRYFFIASVEVAGTPYYFKITESHVQIFKNRNVVSEEPNENLYKDFKAIVNYQLIKLSKCSVGFFNSSGKAKFRTDKNVKSTYIPKNVIYVSSKDERPKRTSSGGSLIRWTDAWTVLCHWRKIAPDSYGLNRLGERKELGRTFIKTYSKGNTEVESQMKVRRVM